MSGFWLEVAQCVDVYQLPMRFSISQIEAPPGKASGISMVRLKAIRHGSFIIVPPRFIALRSQSMSRTTRWPLERHRSRHALRVGPDLGQHERAERG